LNHDESSLLDFGTKLIEAKAVHFAYDSKYDWVSLYIDSTVHSNDAGTYIEFRFDGKTQSVVLYDANHYSNEEKNVPWQLKPFGFENQDLRLFQHYSQGEFKAKLAKAGCKLLVFFRFNAQVRVKLPHHSGSACIGTPNYVKKTKQGVELGFISSGTYNSLPNVIKVSRVNSIQTVSLNTLGIERKGYYSYDLKCSIPKSQAKQAKAFFGKRFRNVA
jgi:hypothetical protein